MRDRKHVCVCEREREREREWERESVRVCERVRVRDQGNARKLLRMSAAPQQSILSLSLSLSPLLQNQLKKEKKRQNHKIKNKRLFLKIIEGCHIFSKMSRNGTNFRNVLPILKALSSRFSGNVAFHTVRVVRPIPRPTSPFDPKFVIFATIGGIGVTSVFYLITRTEAAELLGSGASLGAVSSQRLASCFDLHGGTYRSWQSVYLLN